LTAQLCKEHYGQLVDGTPVFAMSTGEGLVPDNLQSAYTQEATRAELATLAVTLYEIFRGEITGRVTFNDTSDINIQKAAAIGVVRGGV
jgi:hypothetical protein